MIFLEISMEERDWKAERIISVDFDGVLSSYDGWKGDDHLDEPLDGAKEFISKLINSGYKPVVFTTREPKLISNWLKEFGFPNLEVTNTKYPSTVYIDDRCVAPGFDARRDRRRGPRVQKRQAENRCYRPRKRRKQRALRSLGSAFRVPRSHLGDVSDRQLHVDAVALDEGFRRATNDRAKRSSW